MKMYQGETKLMKTIQVSHLTCDGFAGRNSKQRGAAALLITLLLVIIASLSALVVNKAAISEQKLSGNNIRIKEVYGAASGALEFAVNHLQEIYLTPGSYPNWDNTKAGGWGVAGATATPNAAFVSAGGVSTAGSGNIGKGADSYTPTVVYTLLTDEDAGPAVVEIAATAAGVGDTQVTKTATARFLISEVGTADLVDGPPLVVENCIDSGAITGTPDIYDGGIAIGTITGDATCIDPGHFDIVNGGSVGTSVSGTRLWESLFGGLTKAQLKEMSRTSPQRFIYVDSDYLGSSAQATYHPGWNGNTWHDDVGSPEGDADPIDQVVLFFESSVDCPPINGGTTIYGVVYYETSGCNAQGGGGGVIHGTLAFEGDLGKFNANTELHDLTLNDLGVTRDSYRILSIFPGSWKDY